MNFLENWLKNVLFRYLVNSIPNHVQLTNWHSATDQSIVLATAGLKVSFCHIVSMSDVQISKVCMIATEK